MIVLSQNSYAAIDVCAGEIQEDIQRNEHGQEYLAAYKIVLFSFNAAFAVGFYGSLDEAAAVFHDILKHWKDGDEWYDIKAREGAILKKKRA